MIPIRRRLYQSLAGFTPRQLFAALQGAWLEPTLGWIFTDTAGTSAITTGGQTIARINDQSGYGYNATQSTAANRPTYQLDSNGLPLARHDTTDSLSVSLPSINARRNLLTYSEQFSNAFWTVSRSSVSPDRALAPDGIPTADKLVEDTTASSNHRIYNLSTYTAATHRFSVYLKAAERTQAFLRLTRSDGQALGAYFDLSNGSIVSQDAGSNALISQSANGWYRCSISITTQAVATPYIATAVGGSENYTGDGTSGIYIWGAQLELGSVASDYQKITDWTSEAYASSGSVYFATPVGMSALHNQSMGTSYTLPALSSDIYSWIVVPQRLSAVLEGRLDRYMLRKANLPEPDYLLDDDGNQLMSDDYELLLRQ